MEILRRFGARDFDELLGRAAGDLQTRRDIFYALVASGDAQDTARAALSQYATIASWVDLQLAR